jgi:Ca2+-transporting ATPase
LTDDDARQRLERWGPNELQALGTTSAWRTFLAQFRNALILILLSATVASGFLGHTLEAVVISVIVFFAVLRVRAEYRSGARSRAAPMSAPTARAEAARGQ